MRSGYEIWDPHDELDAAHIVNPPCDPFLAACASPPRANGPGPALHNAVIRHGRADEVPERLRALLDMARGLGAR